MIKIEKAVVFGWEAAVRGMRNPMNSWDKSDSEYGCEHGEMKHHCCVCENGHTGECSDGFTNYLLGKADRELMMKLAANGAVHAKFRRMIIVTCDITAPLYWWKEFDTYKVGTVANSCSTMHKIHAKPFDTVDFSCEHLLFNAEKEGEAEAYYAPVGVLLFIIDSLNHYREKFLETKDKMYWWGMIQLLPTSYNQKRTVQMSYEVLNNILQWRQEHKLDEWREFCRWAKTLPYAEVFQRQ